MQWPAPSKVTSSAPVSSAKAALRSGGISLSSSPWTTSSGQRTPASSSLIVALSSPGQSIVRASVSPSVSSAQPTASSICFVECGSE